MRIINRIKALVGHFRQVGSPPPLKRRGSVDHVIILDGTMSSLAPGVETNAGLLFKLVSEQGPVANRSVRYEKGVQFRKWRDLVDVAQGTGINEQIRSAYGFIASRYRAGDRIFLFGYSRGAFAVRSLAGMIDLVGLLKTEHATERNIRQVFRHYQNDPSSVAAVDFAGQYCHHDAPIEMVGVWDTVKALGIRLPFLWKLTEKKHAFHSHQLGGSVRHGYHALALDETRQVYEPVLWNSTPNWPGHLEQMWFRGTHGDIGGQLFGFETARPLSNIPFVWMCEKAEGCGLALPSDWRIRFTTDPFAPSVGNMRGWGKFFWFRSKRVIGTDPSERLHPSAIVYAGREPLHWRPSPQP